MILRYLLLGFGCLLLGCKEGTPPQLLDTGEVISHWEPRYARGFSASHTQSGVVYLQVNSPWPGATRL